MVSIPALPATSLNVIGDAAASMIAMVPVVVPMARRMI